eukprot:TRINITY_DN20213_c0_g2_i1.p1 TRINITY_DN20213_c0_g2~~TRINITY_DN20213_c0_g2_i1.p1  ORF type:complete len:263 (-),score=44.88 TRINITY_DN20213_c0_g2_i1:312-1100(-)
MAENAPYIHLRGEDLNEFKRDQMFMGFRCAWSKEEAHGHHVQLYKALANEYYWSGNFVLDWLFFVLQWHPLLGIFFCHPAHPFSKRERIAVFVFECAATLLPSALLVAVSKAMYHHGTIAKEHETLVSHVSILIFVTLPVSVIEVVLYWLAIIDIYLKDQDLLPRWKIDDYFQSGLKLVARGIFCCFSTMSVVYAVLVTIISGLVLHIIGCPIDYLVYPFMVSRVQSWILWFLTWTFSPYIGFIHSWCTERSEQFQEEAEDA